MLKNKKKGFSLVELMVVIAIMTILMMAAISSFSFYYKTFAETRLINIQKLIEYSVIRARADNTTVIICKATSDSFDLTGKLDLINFKCDSSSKNWGDDPIVAFESQDGSASYTAANDTIIGNLPKGHNENLYLNFNTGNEIEIRPNGFMVNGNGNITYCDRNNKFQAALVTNIVGRVRYTTDQGSYTCE